MMMLNGCFRGSLLTTTRRNLQAVHTGNSIQPTQSLRCTIACLNGSQRRHRYTGPGALPVREHEEDRWGAGNGEGSSSGYNNGYGLYRSQAQSQSSRYREAYRTTYDYDYERRDEEYGGVKRIGKKRGDGRKRSQAGGGSSSNSASSEDMPLWRLKELYKEAVAKKDRYQEELAKRGVCFAGAFSKHKRVPMYARLKDYGIQWKKGFTKKDVDIWPHPDVEDCVVFNPKTNAAAASGFYELSKFHAIVGCLEGCLLYPQRSQPKALFLQRELVRERGFVTRDALFDISLCRDPQAEKLLRLAKAANIPVFLSEMESRYLLNVNSITKSLPKLDCLPKPIVDSGSVELAKAEVGKDDKGTVGGISEKKNPPVWVCLTGLVDAGNMGNILRTCVFYGVTGVLVGKDTNVDATREPSVGAADLCNIAVVSGGLGSFLEKSRSNGWTVYGTFPDKETKSQDELLLEDIPDADEVTFSEEELVNAMSNTESIEICGGQVVSKVGEAEETVDTKTASSTFPNPTVPGYSEESNPIKSPLSLTSRPISDLSLDGPSLIVLGSENEGLDPSLPYDVRIHIPKQNHTVANNSTTTTSNSATTNSIDSLNVSTAAAVIISKIIH
eukprot:Nk52_evm55s212 gene=Nk52_evmTU55s212